MSHSPSRRAVLGAGLATGVAAAAGVALSRSSDATEATPRGPVLIGHPENQRLHVMTFNIRTPVDGSPHTWEERRPRITRLLRRERPTVVGLQESMFHQGQDILAELDGYDWIHLLPEGISEVGATVVCYETARLRPVGYDHLWLSDTPRQIGSASWGNELVRMLTWVRFTDLHTEREFVVVNNNFDHQSKNSRERSAEMLVDLLPEFDVPVLVIGDFNAETDEQPYRTLVEDGDLHDSWPAADERLTKEYGTFNGWDPEPDTGARRIDWILTTPDVHVEKVGINTETDKGLPPSDHWAVQALLHLA
ncbi:endonuclease/exonuclease/phosphatase family metal-dependent hydrolase [Lipingzhangella halophila]|uniref:Endonuclease/exonuclease/phosphatase family metal-dependent hydrolase n=1 Tax=Lipingzhangella halophila TaxID=1783352 RepID=A0A7W7RFY8_9ACTN|nr:endonuclease/exonuclease/phosphatase family protein [Lipingzhangella halophila]MBB4931269.1 endonuclease/exonuclease/phosphatase family metal-dependent hydrolase [Lipingzhangella halophila]